MKHKNETTAYFIGGPDDLTKQVIEGVPKCIRRPMLSNEVYFNHADKRPHADCAIHLYYLVHSQRSAAVYMHDDMRVEYGVQ